MLKVILCTVALILSAYGDDTGAGSGPGSGSGSGSGTGSGSKECNHFDITCTGNNLEYCYKGATIIKQCTSIDPTTPYCDCNTSSCAKTKTCDSVELGQCTNNNEVFPHPQICSKYVICSNGQQKEGTCSAGTSYDPIKYLCVSASSKPLCSSVKCVKPIGAENIPFPAYPQYYLACREGSGTVQKCPIDGFVMTGNKCVFACTKVGSFVDPSKCAQGFYYTCTKPGTTFVKEEHQCLGGTAYDVAQGKCTTAAVSTCATSSVKPASFYALALSQLQKSA